VSEERLQALPSSRDIVIKLKTKYSDGTSHLLFSGLEFVEKLAALVPPPRIHLTRFFGCLAPHAKTRSQIVPKKEEPEAIEPLAADLATEKIKKSKRKNWSELLARVFNIYMKNCSQCGGELKVIAAIIELKAIRKILGHLGIQSPKPSTLSA